MHTRTACGGCGGPNLQPFLDLGTSPLADNFPATPDEPEKRYPLRVAVCTSCWLAQLLDVVPDDELYGKEYGFYSSTSPSIVEYDRQFAAWSLERFPDEIKRGVVEIACNDGSLLQHFAATGVPAIGIEPAVGPAVHAERRGLRVKTYPFSRALARRLRDELRHPAGLVIAKNVAAHVADLPDFLAGIAHLIGDDGVAVVEVQNLADLLLGNQFDHVYHEHRFYFSLTSLGAACWRAGLNVVDVEHTPAQGGSLRVTLRRRQTPDSSRAWWRPAEDWLRDIAAYAALQGRVDGLCSQLSKLLLAERVAGRKVAGYAATAKSATLLNSCAIEPHWIDHVVDTTPAKIGRYTPGTHIPIVRPGDRPLPDTYLLLAWNYLGDVLRRERAFVEAGGRFIVPIPVPVIL
jgi:hypothetical protein